ncbi:MAG: ABC transporter permease, partial [Clostridium sp.]
LAAEAMGRGTPLGTFLAALVFGFADALSNSLQSLRIPAEFVQMIPYLTTIIGLVVYSASKTSKAGKLK